MEILSKLSPSDLTQYIHLVSEASLGTYDKEYPKDTQEACASLDERINSYEAGSDPAAWQEYAIRDEHGDLVGLASYRVSTSSSLVKARVGIHLGRYYWGKGYASLALKDLLKHLREKNVDMVEAIIDPDNAPSIRLFTRNGFKETGIIGGDLWYYLEL